MTVDLQDAIAGLRGSLALAIEERDAARASLAASEADLADAERDLDDTRRRVARAVEALTQP